MKDLISNTESQSFLSDSLEEDTNKAYSSPTHDSSREFTTKPSGEFTTQKDHPLSEPSEEDNLKTDSSPPDSPEEPNIEVYRAPVDHTPKNPPSTREPVRIILIGSSVGVNLITNVLYSLGFAEPRAWSKPQVDPVSGKPMRILTKWIRY